LKKSQKKEAKLFSNEIDEYLEKKFDYWEKHINLIDIIFINQKQINTIKMYKIKKKDK